MQTEKEYLFEVSQALEAIARSSDESRKQEMKKHLHQKVYPAKHRYGFSSVEAVRKSVEYLRNSQSDPTVLQRYKRLKQTIQVLTKAVSDFEKMHGLASPGQDKPGLTLLYNKLRDQDQKDRTALSKNLDRE